MAACVTPSGGLRPLEWEVRSRRHACRRAPDLFADNQIGTVRLLVTPKFPPGRLRDTLIRIVGTIVAVDVLLILCTYLFSGGP